ncbi:hypothetical protein FGO68_gene5181 [Halteria grandinella]|uniref:Uncharacterized protein n=1 Tax=Halteria grandinella TaxID=5974 RepID=A0A8J8P4S1_HALGN|nr:hypothetical protein FGO68_gene5181 [Halteria grandinella]
MMIDELQKRVGEYDNERRVLEGKIYQELQRINNHTDTINDKISGLNTSMSQFHRMHDHSLDEMHKLKSIFNDSRDNFSHLCSKLHEDFTHKVNSLVDKTAMIDEVRNLYLMQIEAHKEDMKRLDFKQQKAISELVREKQYIRVSVERNEELSNKRMMQIEMEYQMLKDGWLRIEKDIKVMDLVLEKLLPILSFQQTSQILFAILNNDQEFNKLIDLQSPFYDKMQLDLAESKNRLGFYTNRLEFNRPDIPQFKELPQSSVAAVQKRKSIWNELDLSLMLADDPDSEFQRLQEEGNNELKLPVRMTITEFTALVEIVRMHKKKFKAYEKKSHKRQQASNSATGTKKTSVKQAESSQQRRDTVIIDIKQSRKNSDIKKRLPTKTPRQTAHPELQAIRQGLNQSINEKDESEEQDSDKSAFQQELFERNLGQKEEENRERKVSINKKRKPSSYRTGIEKKSRKQTDAFVIQEIDQQQNNAQEESKLREREDSSDTELPIQQSILNTK